MLHLLLFTSFVFVVFSSPLKVSLKPSWNDTPLFYETLSYVSNDASHHFYDFITSLTQSPIFSSTGEDAYNQLIKIASNYVDQSLLELSLSLRSESPFVAASDSLPVACESILYGNECGTVDEVINTTSQFNYPKYLLHLVGNISNQAIVVIPQPSLNLTLQKLLKHYQNGLIGGISLLLRPSLASGLKDGIFVGLDDMTLPGYDVEVMHRNFKKEFGLTRDKDDYMYLKEIDSAKIRAAVSTVLMNNSQKFIETLQSNVQYLPYSLVELSKVDNKRMYYSFSNQNEMADQIFAINRIPFDFATHSVYDFLTIIRNEQRLQQLLKSHNLPTSLISSSTPHLTQPLIRFEIPQQLMISINSFEHKMYGKFSKQLTSFFQYNPYRLFRFTAADLYTFVITASFSTDQNVDQTLTLLKSVETFMYRYMAVMKYSIFPIDKPTTEKGEILLAALLDIDKRWGYDGLMKFIDKIGDMEVFTVDRLKSCIYDVYREYGESFYNPKQIIDSSNNINNMVNYAQEHGFKTSCVFLNGIYMSIDNLYNEIGKVYGNDIKLLEGLIQKRSITEGNVYQQLHKHFVFFDYFDETLTKTTNQSLATGQNILSLKFNEKEKHIITLCNVNKEIQHLALSEAYKNNYYFYYGTKDINLSNSITELVRLGRIDKAKELLTSNDFIEDCSDDIVIFDSIKFNVSKHLSSQIEIIKMVHSPLHSYLQSQVSKK
ncbi:UDP-glucose glycoprotein:glucosyltransferase [Entamoeba marina]